MLIRTTRRQQRISDLRPVLGVFVLLEALAFLLGALLHAGVEIPIGGGMYLEHVVPATIVESVCSLVLAVGAVALITRNRRAWEATLSAHVIAIAGTILGIVAITAGRGEHNLPNDIFHRIVLVAMVAVLVLLWTPTGRRAIRRDAAELAVRGSSGNDRQRR